jgi:hypothetical protein
MSRLNEIIVAADAGKEHCSFEFKYLKELNELNDKLGAYTTYLGTSNGMYILDVHWKNDD